MSPSAIFTQNARSTSRRIGGRPGDLIAGLPVCVTNHPGRLPITHLHIKMLRRPLESAQYLAPTGCPAGYALTVQGGTGGGRGAYHCKRECAAGTHNHAYSRTVRAGVILMTI